MAGRAVKVRIWRAADASVGPGVMTLAGELAIAQHGGLGGGAVKALHRDGEFDQERLLGHGVLCFRKHHPESNMRYIRKHVKRKIAILRKFFRKHIIEVDVD